MKEVYELYDSFEFHESYGIGERVYNNKDYAEQLAKRLSRLLLHDIKKQIIEFSDSKEYADMIVYNSLESQYNYELELFNNNYYRVKVRAIKLVEK